RSALEMWEANLWELKAADEKDRIFGCHLLMTCYKAQEERPKLAERMAKDASRLLAIIRETAAFLTVKAEANLPAPPGLVSGFADDKPSDQGDDTLTRV